jgi:tellurite methyltransferase
MNTKNTLKEKKYWNKFYTDNINNKDFMIPSQFCCLMATEIDTSKSIAEFGCGNGRDSIFLARHGFNVMAMDLSDKGVAINNDKIKDYDNISFFCGDVSRQEDVSMLLDETRLHSKAKNIVIYSRFFLHSLDDRQESIFLGALSDGMIKGDLIYFEFRENADLVTQKIYEDHFRRFVNSDKLLERLISLNFDINYHAVGTGMAKYHEEDPIVARVMAVKQ